MPLVKARPRGDSDGSIVRQFDGSVDSNLTTYTYDTAQENLSIWNKGSVPITLNVGTYSVTIQPKQTWQNDVDFASFTVKTTTGIGEIRSTAREYDNRPVSRQEIKFQQRQNLGVLHRLTQQPLHRLDMSALGGLPAGVVFTANAGVPGGGVLTITGNGAYREIWDTEYRSVESNKSYIVRCRIKQKNLGSQPINDFRIYYGVKWYDKDKVLIGNFQSAGVRYMSKHENERYLSTIITTPANVRYVRFLISAGSDNTDSVHDVYDLQLVPFLRKEIVPILAYHAPHDFNGKPYTFTMQMEFLARHGYRTVTITDIARMWRENIPIPDNCVCLTFDDGSESVYTTWYPIMEKHGLKGVFAIISDAVGQETHNEGTNVYAPFASWGQLSEMAANGWEICSHSKTHTIPWDSQGDAQLQAEIADSKTAIETNLGLPCNVIVYPNGEFAGKVAKYVDEAGYWAGFTVNGQKWQSDLMATEGSGTAYSRLPFAFTRSYVYGDSETEFKQALNFDTLYVSY
ncbi:polysaccharide deacetylase family protein [Desulfosporosinus hippei]|uniref:Polysaccharide deacetylase n=1 Tax=Desulfosporosinus hippei DSM 8344 TaxID=1121419 RepID=A0A1G7UJM2_9FIRM|nr:polysaccharide deacetylase family protein [Desulfosporosinus hippei]SDG47538.1 Polysaccharide deacetylase [Desulfosporosinus hippei DSM 8344]